MALRLNIAVAGAGPAGLATALYLFRLGHAVTVFERFDSPQAVGSGLILQPTGQAVMADLGLLKPLSALGQPIHRLKGHDAGSGRTVLDVSYSALGKEQHGLGLHRAVLFSVLLASVRQAGVTVETGVTISDIDHSDAPKVKLIDDAGQLRGRFDLVVDCLGARTPLLRHARTPANHKLLPYGALWTTTEWRNVEGFDMNTLMQCYDKASVMIGILPIGKLRQDGVPLSAFFWSIRHNESEGLKIGGLPGWKKQIESYWPKATAHANQVHRIEDLVPAIYGHHTLKVPAGKGIAFVGDSAHSTSPQLGQGANMALLDAAALGVALRSTDDIDAALNKYAALRRRHIRIYQMLSMRLTPFYQSDSTMMPFLRDNVLVHLMKVGPIQQVLAKMIAGTAFVDPTKGLGIDKRLRAESALRR
ncbi:FAD-dependent oxidoreductase [Cucumibacter marinus]|uniref:FAD-dependent oxidoreductase n=1 Tax=Cucumibacter marinus TaxID=1121252 RepID=UPI000411EA24|nr:NAD(P)/FAD-dependent oxidoreductase [Cucumibacter marinus]